MKKFASLLNFSDASVLSKTGVDLSWIKKCCVDSRLVAPGDLFFALPGAKVDGHAFLQEAQYRGAAAAVVHRSYRGESSLPLIPVDNVLLTLQDLAKNHLQSLKPKNIVGVTGSFGKTTTKTFLHQFLSSTFKVGTNCGNYNSQIGLPLTLLNQLEGDEEIILLEMAMTEAGQLTRLVQIAPLTHAMITAIDYVHIGYFEGLEGIAHAKAEIFSSPKIQGGWVNYDAPHRDVLLNAGSCPKKTFSVHQTEADIHAVPHPDRLLLSWKNALVDLGSQQMIYPLKHNLVAAATAALDLGVPPQAVSQIAQQIKTPEKRFQIIHKSGFTIVSDSYNASGMRFALQNLPAGKRKIAALGIIPDLGKFSVPVHEEVAEIALKHLDILYCFGEECLPMVALWRKHGRHVEHFASREALAAALKELVVEGDVVLVKGALRFEMWKIVEALNS